MLAVHHSHPASPARPSVEDIRLALTPDVLYTILSLQDADSPVLKAFFVDDGVVKEHPLVIEAQ
jgi:proteasome lid subunit RPN8/RPN11